MRGIWANFLISGYVLDEEVEFLGRVRTLNLTGLVLIAFGLLWMSSFVVHGAHGIAGILALLTGAYFCTLLMMRRLRNLNLISHLLVSFLFCGVVVSNCYTGGLAYSNDVPFFVVPVLAIFLLGPWGLVWVGLSLVAVGVFQYLEINGYEFDQVIPEEDHIVDAGLTWVAALAVVAGVAYLYDRSQRRSKLQLVAAKDRAEQAARAKSQFLANMSHEFRTPLHAVIGLTELSLKSVSDEEVRRNLTMVKASAYSLLTMVDDVLDISRIEAKRLALRPEPFDPRELLDELAGSHRVLAQAKGLTLRLDQAEGLPARVVGDRVRLRQVLANLVDNAIKFTDEGGLVVTAEGEQGGWVRFQVLDTGIGIERDKLDRIFDSFNQVDGSSSRRHGGSGLGLAICAELVDMMGGSISVESQPGQGSRFEVRLPLAAPEQGSFSPAGVRILAAEDDRLSRELVATVLGKAGYRVDVVADGNQAIEAVQSKRYDLILMDLQMPGVDGLEAARRIRAHLVGRERIPVLALTAHAVEEVRERCIEAGLDDFVVKPIEPGALIAVVERWLLRVSDPPDRLPSPESPGSGG